VKRTVIITATGFQDEELIYPWYRLQEAGFHVDMATKDNAVVYGKYGVPARPTMATSQLNSDNYDAVIIPGGFEAPDRMRIMPEVIDFVAKMDAKGKLVAAICHGPWVLISADIVRGRRMTAYWSIEADLRNAGAIYRHKENVVIDRNMITSPHYHQNGDFMRAVVEYLAK
jgi:protease I